MRLPFRKALRLASAAVRDGKTIYQKFACAGCGVAQYLHSANTFFDLADCQECGATTNIAQGVCGFYVRGRGHSTSSLPPESSTPVLGGTNA